ncbi:S8 family serine peptidase [Fulvivirga sp. M361]|uniref:S8 family serine peptidase n=1 Tax=Fulvivirga sp. M361 TaxID=2594266 RepID=UPI00117A4C70|nr:S8 family serine peptidase [Fulvivirga sp. M361]TRX51992.1 S8 family serine peptidase [Fulvivirga sp. M361]
MRIVTQFILVTCLIGTTVFVNGQGLHRWSRYIENTPVKPDVLATHTYIIEFEGSTNELVQKGLNILRVLNSTHYIVQPKNLKNIPEIEVVERANPFWKLSDALYQKYQIKKDFSGRLNIVVNDVKGFINDLEKLKTPFLIVNTYKKILVVDFPKSVFLDQLMTLSSVKSIEDSHYLPRQESPLRDFNYNVNHINRIRDLVPNLNGGDLTVSIKELQYDASDIDFKGRHLPNTISAAGISNHATEMATIIAGGGNSSFQGLGIAWGARLTSSDFSSLLPDDDTEYTQLNVTVQNHSYGTIPENFYGAFARAYDLNANNNPELLHIFSAGNAGQITTEEGPYEDVEKFANITGNFKMAKNILVIGGSDTLTNPIEALSKGPAFDGRVKPELVAYSQTGSSSSAAVVSGVSLLLQQRYTEIKDHVPSSALIKAILINSANDIGRKHVDYTAGFGNVNAFDALKAIDNGLFSQGEVTQGSSVSLPITLPDNALNLKVSLVWNDPAAAVNSSRALINDLDLSVRHNDSGVQYLPWVLNSFPHVDSLRKLPVRKEDHLNNVEQVSVQDPLPGNYSIEVKGFDITTASQQFFIAFQWDDADQFTWTYPTASDNLPQDGEFQSFFRWESTKEETKGQLEYTMDNGNTWSIVDNNVDLSKSYFSWSPPEVDTRAKARMTIADQVYETEEFVISRALKADIGFNCPDSLLITWPKVERATHYVISTPGDFYLEEIIQTADTSVVLEKAMFSQTLFTVTPFFDNKPGLRNLSFDYISLGVGCFISNFLANLNPGTGADLSLTLSTTYQVEEVTFQRLVDEGFQDIATFTQPTGVQLSFTDDETVEKRNVYRGRVRFSGGTEVYTKNDTVFFLKNTVAVLFPNPVAQSDELSVLMKDFNDNEAFLRLYNTRGQFLREHKLAKESDSISMRQLKQGLYFYEIISAGERQTGRIVVK